MLRRCFLGVAAACAASAIVRPRASFAQAKALAYADMHSHIGILGGAADVREAMTRNGMLCVSRQIVADGPVIRRFPGKGVRQVRAPAAGELAGAFDAMLERIRAEHQAQNLVEIVDTAALQRVLSGAGPGVVLSAEGGDFIDGDLKRLETARAKGVTHVQLVHYRVSDIGDISTERPVHNGLTAFGKEVVAACNRLGILVDVAHATTDGIAQALEVSTKPLIYSHGNVTSASPFWTYGAARARAIHAPLAKRIAGKGGVVGLWPLGSQFGSLDAYTGALIDMAESLGAAHVGIGSDMFGLGGITVIHGYEQFPQIAERLAKRGLTADDVANIMGANYLRVLGQAMAV